MIAATRLIPPRWIGKRPVDDLRGFVSDVAIRLAITVIVAANIAPRRVVSTTPARPLPTRPTVPPRPTPAPAVEPEAAGKKKTAKPKQETLPLEGVTRGRFDRSEPTLYDGEDLDVPTFLRRGISLKR